jgi:hypothetical protein
MPDGGKPGNPKSGFPPFPPSLEIAAAISTFPQVRRFCIITQELKTQTQKLLPMSSDKTVTYVPGRAGAGDASAFECEKNQFDIFSQTRKGAVNGAGYRSAFECGEKAICIFFAAP